MQIISLTNLPTVNAKSLPNSTASADKSVTITKKNFKPSVFSRLQQGPFQSLQKLLRLMHLCKSTYVILEQMGLPCF